MVKAYRISNKIKISQWFEIANSFKGEIEISPVQDINGNLFISREEYKLIKFILKEKLGKKFSLVYLHPFTPKKISI